VIAVVTSRGSRASSRASFSRSWPSGRTLDIEDSLVQGR
jgi:hypothetical protein